MDPGVDARSHPPGSYSVIASLHMQDARFSMLDELRLFKQRQRGPARTRTILALGPAAKYLSRMGQTLLAKPFLEFCGPRETELGLTPTPHSLSARQHAVRARAHAWC